MTHASTVQIDDAPEAVIRYKQGYCGQCWDRMQLERPMTEKEIRAKATLEAWLVDRRKRLAKRDREQFYKNPIFPTLEVRYTEAPPPEPEDKETHPVKSRPHKRGEYRKATEDRYPQGSIAYTPMTAFSWGYEIRDREEVVLDKNTYGYSTIKQARVAARRTVTSLGWQESERVTQRGFERMNKAKRLEQYGH
jgi:hypothetical protein